MRRGRRALLLTAATLVLAASPLVAATKRVGSSPPRVSEEQAKQTAAAVAKSLDLPWDETATATFSGPSWKVRCQRATITVLGDTGQVTELSRPRTALPSTAAKQLSRDEAVAIATRVMDRLGMPPDAVLTEAEQHQAEWRVAWERRTPEGIPYDGEGSMVFLHGGNVASAFRGWSSGPLPESTEVKVTEEQAVRVATSFMKQEYRLRTRGPFVAASLRVVQPNDWPARRPSRADEGAVTRVAWAVGFTQYARTRLAGRGPLRPKPGDWLCDFVWIDAADARILGGRTVPTGPPPAPTKQSVAASRYRLAAALGAGAVFLALVAAVVRRARRRTLPQAGD
jgi:hypothetical protein